jgi:hypothetical protein
VRDLGWPAHRRCNLPAAGAAQRDIVPRPRPSIDAAAEQGVFIAVRGDTYSSRAWCLRELIKAKRQRLPMLTVEALTNGERRSSAYSGNGPTITWGRDNPRPSASRVARLAMVELVSVEESQLASVGAAMTWDPLR